MSVAELLVIFAAFFAVGYLGGRELWRRRRSVRSIVTPAPAERSIPTAEQARRWRLQALDEEHAFWDERFRAAGGIPPLRGVDRERVDRMYGDYLFTPYMGSNSRFVDSRLATARSMRQRFLDMTAEPPTRAMQTRLTLPDHALADCPNLAPYRTAPTDWRTPLRDLVDPA